MRASSRRTLSAVFAAGSATLLIASAAYACTTYKGYFTIQGNGYAAVTAIGNNANGAMGYCQGPPKTAKVPNLGTFTASVAPKTGNCAAQMDQGEMDINYVSTTAQGDCMSGLVGVVRQGGLVVDANGNGGPTTYTLTGATLGSGSICVATPPPAARGNQIPVNVV